MSFAQIAARLAPAKVIARPNRYGYKPGVVVLERTGGRREVGRVNKWYVYEDWELTRVFRDKTTDEDLDAFITRAWSRLSSLAMPDSWESEYGSPENGNLRLAIARFTTITMEPVR